MRNLSYSTQQGRVPSEQDLFAGSSGEPQASVNGKGLAGDEVRAGGKEEDGLGNVVGVAVAAHGRFGCKAGGLRAIGGAARRSAGLIGRIIHFNPAGSDAVHVDFGREGLGHGLREHVQRGLGRTVVGVPGPCVQTAKRTDVDDAAAGGAQMRQSLAGDEERAAGVGLEDSVPLLEGQALEGRGGKDSGVVDEDV